MKTKVALIILIITLISSMTLVYAADENVTTASYTIKPDSVITVKVDGKAIAFPDALPYINEDNRTLVPVRFVSEALGAAVDWQEGTQLVTISKGSTRIALRIGDNFAIINNSTSDSKVTFDTKAVLKDSRTFVPLRFISETLNCSVDWDSTSRTVTITTLNLSASDNEQLPIDTNCGLTKEQILTLKAYPDNEGLGSSNLDFHMTNEQYLAKYGLNEAKMSVAIAKGHMEAINNVDYRVGLDEFEQKEKQYIDPQSYNSLVKRNVKEINDYKMAVKGTFYTDPSLVYVDSAGTIRVRGTMKYIVYSCTDVEKIFGKGVKLNQWIEEDVDVQLYSLTIGQWAYYYRAAYWLSPSPRFVKGE